jgi:ribosomal protein L23
VKYDVTSIDGAAAGSLELSDAIFGLEPRADIIARMVRWQLARRQSGDHKTLGRADIARTGKKMYKQKGTGGARHGSARVPQFRGGGRAMGPVTRSHEHDLPKKVRALALRHALSAKQRAGGLILWERAALDDAKTKALREKPAAGRRAAGPGRQRLRHHAPREAGSDPGCGRSAGGAVQMSKDARHYDTIVAPVITEKATIASENNQFVFKVRRDATKPEIKAAVEKLFDVKVTAVNTVLRKGKNKVFRGVRGKQQDVKKAVVTLADGHRIDVTSGL